MDPEDPISIFADMKLNSDDFFQILETHRKSCQREGRYDEAELTRLRILELRAHEEKAKRDYLQAKHQAEKAGLVEAHKMEIEKLNEIWETDLMPRFEDSVRSAVIELRDKHRREMEELRDRKEREIEKTKQHPPSEILNLRKRVDSLASAGEYMAAKKIKMNLIEAENHWHGKIDGKSKDKWSENIEKLIEKQERELNSLLDKLEKQRQLKKAQWQKEIEILKKRYNNVRNDLTNQHKIEKQKLVKEFSVKRQAMESITKKPRKLSNLR
ncbi:unnamed protein product [Blepharisma stoltei]|uniref:Uncharacterized protein n=1 Tax=Blepharisma stoltei TaxID=1481888 RepID=A0AAU9ISS8_9CILI|nr:unnamed protein product [Blepharisma stoltei]